MSCRLANMLFLCRRGASADEHRFYQFIGGARVWPLGTLFALGFRDTIGWRGTWGVIGLGGLVAFALSFALPKSPRWLVTHGQARWALGLLDRMGLGSPTSAERFEMDEIANIHSDPMGVVFRRYRKRIIVAMVLVVGFWMNFLIQLAGLSRIPLSPC